MGVVEKVVARAISTKIVKSVGERILVGHEQLVEQLEKETGYPVRASASAQAVSVVWTGSALGFRRQPQPAELESVSKKIRAELVIQLRI